MNALVVALQALIIIHAARALVIPGGYHLFSNNNLSNLQKAKIAIESQLSSLYPPLKSSSQSESFANKLPDEVLILPRTLLHDRILSQLGLSLPSNESSHIDLRFSHGSISNLEIPKGVSTTFIYNTTEHLGAFEQITSNESKFINAICRGFPFKVPQLVNLVNFYLVVPQSYITRKNLTIREESSYFKSILKAPLSKVPVFKDCVKDGEPVMVFMLNNDRSLKGKAFETAFMVKDYLLGESFSTYKSSFFDKFAANWIKNVGYDSLAHSTFCSTSRNDQNSSYCLSIKDKINKLHIYPAFTESKTHIFSEPKSDSEHPAGNKINLIATGEEVETAAEQEHQQNQKRQNFTSQSINGKTNRAAKKLSEVTYDLAHDPKPILQAKIGDPLSQLPGKVVAPLAHLKEKGRLLLEELEQDRDAEVQWDGYYQAIERINSQAQTNADKLEVSDGPEDQYKKGTTKEYEHKKKRSNTFDSFTNTTNENEHQNEVLSEQDPAFKPESGAELEATDLNVIYDFPQDGREWEESVKNEDYSEEVTTETDDFEIDSEINSNDGTHKHEEDQGAPFTNDREYMLPLSLLQEELSGIPRAPRNKSYAQVIFGWNTGDEQQKTGVDESDSIGMNFNKRNGEDCVEISWYSVFRYSIFGQPNFCMDDPPKITK